MEPRTIVALIVKTAGLLLLIYAVVLAPDRVAGYLGAPQKSGALLFGWVLFPVAVPLAVGAFLFLFPAVSASAVVGRGSGSAIDANLQVVIFSGIGLYTLLQGSISLAYYIALRLFLANYDPASLADPTTKARLAGAVRSVVLGAALLLGARGLSGLLNRLRA